MDEFVFLNPNMISEFQNSDAVSTKVDLITSQHKTKPKFISWLVAALKIANENMIMTSGIPGAFDVDRAIGIQLDTLGVIIGRSRILNFQLTDGSSPILNDSHYRLALKAKIAQNQWDGTIAQIYTIWGNLFPKSTLQIIDNQNMTMSALIDGDIDEVAGELIAAGYIIPKPAGVGLTIIGLTSASSMSYMGILVSGIQIIEVSTNTP